MTDDVDLTILESISQFLNGRGDPAGKVDDNGDTRENRIQINPVPSDGEDPTQVFLHEMGHTGGSEHDDKETSDRKNFMRGCRDCQNVSFEQLIRMLENVKEKDNDE